MSDIIHVLNDAVANQIAAGEVIQRPASVVKELMENAVDAGAGSISVLIKDAGKTLIQVIDNGTGMSDQDAVRCFERHATSKISSAEDLFTIKTCAFPFILCIKNQFSIPCLQNDVWTKIVGVTRPLHIRFLF